MIRQNRVVHLAIEMKISSTVSFLKRLCSADCNIHANNMMIAGRNIEGIVII